MSDQSPTAAQVTLALETVSSDVPPVLRTLAEEVISRALRTPGWSGGDIPYGTAVDEHLLVKLRAFAAIRDILFLDTSVDPPVYTADKATFPEVALDMVRRAVLEAEPSVRENRSSKG